MRTGVNLTMPRADVRMRKLRNIREMLDVRRIRTSAHPHGDTRRNGAEHETSGRDQARLNRAKIPRKRCRIGSDAMDIETKEKKGGKIWQEK